jgi:hypothetical protein
MIVFNSNPHKLIYSLSLLASKTVGNISYELLFGLTGINPN